MNHVDSVLDFGAVHSARLDLIRDELSDPPEVTTRPIGEAGGLDPVAGSGLEKHLPCTTDGRPGDRDAAARLQRAARARVEEVTARAPERLTRLRIEAPAILLAFVIVCGTLALSMTRPAAAHPSIDVQIEDLDQRILKAPKDAVLYLRRAELHRVHRDWPAARADFQAARRLDPGLLIVDLCFGRMLLEQGLPGDAKVALDRYLRQRPSDSEGLLLRGRALAQLGWSKDAIEDYRRAIASSSPKTPSPDTFLELANILTSAGGTAGSEVALRVLEQGIAALGPTVSLVLPAIEVETALGRYDDALRRLDAAAPRTGRREKWLLRRADILKAAGRAQEAGRTYQEVLDLMAAEAPERQSVAFMKEIANQARAGLAQVGGPRKPDSQEGT